MESIRAEDLIDVGANFAEKLQDKPQSLNHVLATN